MAIPYEPSKSTEERIIDLLKNFSLSEDAQKGEQWIRSFSAISCAYAEYTGGYIKIDVLMRVLSDECFK